LRLLLLLDDGPAKHLARIYGDQTHGGLDIGLLLLLLLRLLLLSLDGLLLLRVDYLELAHGVYTDYLLLMHHLGKLDKGRAQRGHDDLLLLLLLRCLNLNRYLHEATSWQGKELGWGPLRHQLLLGLRLLLLNHNLLLLFLLWIILLLLLVTLLMRY
jgi:hypothetical protein